MRKFIPWYLKIAIKVVLARLPISYGAWAKAGMFKHGQMASSDYARKIFNIHMEEGEKCGALKDGVYLEMGTGDSVASALMAKARGAQKSYLVDVDAFATLDVDFYRKLAETLRKDTGSLPEFPEKMSFEDMLKLCDSEYLTQGLLSLRDLPENSIDFIWSHATLEHVRKHEFEDTIRETYRILKPGGLCSHNIDLKDHLGGALNNLRFKENTWESEWMVQSGFYTNRLRYSHIMKVFKDAGFAIEVENAGKWDTIPTPKSKMAKPFCDLPDEELLIRGISLVVRKPN